MRTKTLFLTTAVLVAGMIPAMAQSNPGSTNGTDVEMPLSWPDGTIYVSSDHDNDKSYERPDEWGTQPGTGVTNIVNWDELSGGTGSSGAHSGNPYFSPYNYQDTWAGGRWPEFGQGVQTSIPDGGTNVIGAPDGTSVYTSISYGSLSFSSSRFIPWLGTNDDISIQYNDQKELSMLTGGDPTSSGDELYIISSSAETVDFLDFPVFDPYNPTFPVYTTVPYQQISIGSFGNLDTNGNLYVVLPTHKSAVVTPHINSSKYYYANIHGQGYRLVSQCYATTPANQNRTTVGVGEQVLLSFNPALPVQAVWSATAGSLTYITNASTTLTAPSNAANVTVTATILGKPVSMSFNVVEPSGIDHAIIAATNSIAGAPTFTNGQAGAEMLLYVYYAPTNVSFYRVSIMEIGEDGTNISGYFNQWTPSQLHHNTADHWTQLNQANQLNDTCSGGPYSSPWSSGSFTWNIPAGWQVTGSGRTNSKAGWNQVFSIDGSGTVTINKNNHSVQRTTSNVITTH